MNLPPAAAWPGQFYVLHSAQLPAIAKMQPSLSSG